MHRQHHCIERVALSSCVHEVPLARAGDRADSVAQQDFRSEARGQLCNQLLDLGERIFQVPVSIGKGKRGPDLLKTRSILSLP